MAIAPRLDLRQTQTLVMTPQLRQAIKLLQFSNIEVRPFVEEELERNPLLERDEAGDAPPLEHAAPDQIVLARMPRQPTPSRRRTPERCRPRARRRWIPTMPRPTTPAGWLTAPDRWAGSTAAAAIRGFEADDRGIDDLEDGRRPLREYLGEQLRLSFADPVDRMIGAHLIALLCPAGRLTAEPAAIAEAMGLPLERVEDVRGRMMRFDPPGLFARDLKECLAAQLADLNRLDPAMQVLLDNLDLLARRETRKLMALCGVDSEDLADMIGEIRALDPKPGATWDSQPAQLVVPDILMRAGPDGSWLIELNPRHHAARAGERALLCPRRSAGEEGGAGVPDRAPGQRQLAGALAAAARADHPARSPPRSCASRTASCGTAWRICAR